MFKKYEVQIHNRASGLWDTVGTFNPPYNMKEKRKFGFRPVWPFPKPKFLLWRVWPYFRRIVIVDNCDVAELLSMQDAITLAKRTYHKKRNNVRIQAGGKGGAKWEKVIWQNGKMMFP